LQGWARRYTTAHALAARAQIILKCATAQTNLQVAAKLPVSRATVGKWRKRFAEKRLDGLLDEPRPGAPRKITDRDVRTCGRQDP
jgi:transposase